jgi:hypothetical protein
MISEESTDRIILPSLKGFQHQKQEQQKQSRKTNTKFNEMFKGVPFWIEDKDYHNKLVHKTDRHCCFNHIIGLSKKQDGKPTEIFDYELNIVNTLKNNKNVFIKKARGLGVTEILLRYMAWLAVSFDKLYTNCRFHIVMGPILPNII